MRFTVVWNPEAIEELTEIWLRSNIRDRVSLDADSIDRYLAEDPQTKGKVRQTHRVLLLDTLAAAFQVSDDDRMVRVLHVLSR